MASSLPSPQLVSTETLRVSGGALAELAIPFPAGTFGVTLMSSSSVASMLLDPSGSTNSSISAESAEAQQPIRTHSAASSESATWTLRIENTSAFPATVALSAWVLGGPLALNLTVGNASPDGTTLLLARFTDDESPVPNAQVVAHVQGVVELLMLDDGAHGDGGSGDGLYGVETGALRPGLYPVIAIATAPVGTRATTGLISTEDMLYVPEPGALGSVTTVLLALGGLARGRWTAR